MMPSVGLTVAMALASGVAEWARAPPRSPCADDLHRDVEGEDEGHGEDDRARYDSAWIGDLAARSERGLHARKGEQREDDGAAEAAAQRDAAPRRTCRDALVELDPVDEPHAGADEQPERDQLDQGRDGDKARRKKPTPTQVDEHQPADDREDQRRARHPAGERGDARPGGIGEGRRDAAARQDARQPDADEAGDEAGARPERRLDRAVDAAARWHAAAGVGDAGDHRAHGDGADEEGKRGGRADVERHHRPAG